MLRVRKGLMGLAALATIAVPLAITAPAEATRTTSGCTVTPLAPEFHNEWTSGGDKRIQYKLEVDCTAGRTIRMEMERWEADWTSADDFIGSTVLFNDFTGGGGTVTRTVTATLPDADPGGDHEEEMFHAVSFTVSSGGVTSPATWWDYSPTRTFHL